MNPHTVVMGGVLRCLAYGGRLPFVDGGVTNLATMQCAGVTVSASQIETSYPIGFSGRIERNGGDWLLAYRTGDPITAGKARVQVNLPPLPPGDYTHAFSVRLGSDLPGEAWEMRAPAASPVLLWQLKSQSPTAPQPVLSVNADTDPFDAERLVVFVAYKPIGSAAGPERAAAVFGIERHSVINVELAGRWAPDDSGFVRVSINGDQVCTIRGRTMSDDTPHQVGAGAYLYTHADPATAPTRVTRWQRLAVY